MNKSLTDDGVWYINTSISLLSSGVNIHHCPGLEGQVHIVFKETANVSKQVAVGWTKQLHQTSILWCGRTLWKQFFFIRVESYLLLYLKMKDVEFSDKFVKCLHMCFHLTSQSHFCPWFSIKFVQWSKVVTDGCKAILHCRCWWNIFLAQYHVHAPVINLERIKYEHIKDV